MQWLSQHWGYVALAYAVVSDVMPFLPSKANGIAQAIANILKAVMAAKPADGAK